jgi:hypothetical protein
MSKNERAMNHSHVPGASVRSGRSRPGPLARSEPAGIRLQLPPGEADIEQLRSITREWLVPRLVEKFLRVHGVELKHSHQRANRVQPSLLGHSASTVQSDIKSQAKKKTNYRALV